MYGARVAHIRATLVVVTRAALELERVAVAGVQGGFQGCVMGVPALLCTPRPSLAYILQ